MDKHDIIVIGASAGGVEALTDLFRRMRANIQAAVFIVVHISPATKSYLPSILSRLGGLPVVHPYDGQQIRIGQAMVAPPNMHMEIDNGHVRLTFGPKENGFRPAVDPLFESAARTYGRRVIGIILSGNLHDGSKGLLAVKKAGGIAVVQDPEMAIYPGMPSSALEYVQVDHVLSVPEIADLINMLQDRGESIKGGKPVAAANKNRSDPPSELIANEFKNFEMGQGSNHRSILTCPDCGGVLWELQDERIVHYRCHVGHEYSPEILLADQDNRVENAFWTAIRVLVEKAALSNRLAVRAKRNGYTDLEKIYLEQARQAELDAELLRDTWFIRMRHLPGVETSGERGNKVVTEDIEQDSKSEN